MKQIVLIFIVILYSCGSGLEPDGPDSLNYVFIIRNNTGSTLTIKSCLEENTEIIPNNGSFQCECLSDVKDTGLCSGFIEIRIEATKNGFRCHAFANEVEGLCFVEDFKLFTTSSGTIFTEIGTRTYEYVLTPELLEGAFELPD